MQDVQDNAGGAALGQIPIMLLTEDAMQPSIRISCFTTESALGLRPFMGGQDAEGRARCLIMEKE
jgi:hypothetical protein